MTKAIVVLLLLLSGCKVTLATEQPMQVEPPGNQTIIVEVLYWDYQFTWDDTVQSH